MAASPGAVNECIIRRADGSKADVKKATEVEIAAGDSVTFLTAGGGGYGDPRERTADAKAHDVSRGRRHQDGADHDRTEGGSFVSSTR